MEQTKKIKVVSCSGASNTGEFSDLIARKLDATGRADMHCLAKIAIGDKNLIDNLKQSELNVVVLDGCPINCAEKILNREDITKIHHLNTTDFGITKGKTPVTEEKIDEIMQYITTLS